MHHAFKLRIGWLALGLILSGAAGCDKKEGASSGDAASSKTDAPDGPTVTALKALAACPRGAEDSLAR